MRGSPSEGRAADLPENTKPQRSPPASTQQWKPLAPMQTALRLLTCTLSRAPQNPHRSVQHHGAELQPLSPSGRDALWCWCHGGCSAPSTTGSPDTAPDSNWGKNVIQETEVFPTTTEEAR